MDGSLVSDTQMLAGKYCNEPQAELLAEWPKDQPKPMSNNMEFVMQFPRSAPENVERKGKKILS